MYNEEIGTFRGRYEDCAKLKIDTGKLNEYLYNSEKRESDLKSIMSKNSEMLEKNPKMKEFLTKYSESLNKLSKYKMNMQNVQEINNQNQITM